MFSAVGAPVRRLVRVRIRHAAHGRHGAGRGTRTVSRGARPAGAPGQRARRRRDRRAAWWSASTAPAAAARARSASRAAEQLGYRFCDTGVLYRGLTWLAMRARRRHGRCRQPLVALVPQHRARARRAPALRAPARRRHARSRPSCIPRRSTARSAACRSTPRCAPRCCPSSARSPRQGRMIMAGRDIGTRRAARRRPEALPRRLGQGARPAPGRGARRGSMTPAALAADRGRAAPARRASTARAPRQPLRIPTGATVDRHGGQHARPDGRRGGRASSSGDRASWPAGSAR